MANYDLHSLDLPKLTGRALRLFAGAVSNPATRGAFLPALLKQGGFAALRALHPEEAPTFGRVSERGAVPLCWSVAHLGPIGATVEDVALAYAIMAGPDPRDPLSQAQPPVTLAGWNNPDLAGARLGIYRPWFQHAAPAIVALCEAMLDQFKRAGAQVYAIEIPELDLMRLAHIVTILSEMAASIADHPDEISRLGPSVRLTLALTAGFSPTDYVKAQRIRTRALATFAGVFEQVDAIITPATAITAPPIPPGGSESGWSDLSVTTELMRYVFPGNLAGLPAITFPVGYDEHELPIGMQGHGAALGRGAAAAPGLRGRAILRAPPPTSLLPHPHLTQEPLEAPDSPSYAALHSLYNTSDAIVALRSLLWCASRRQAALSPAALFAVIPGVCCHPQYYVAGGQNG
jgi:hypothetical protein